MIIVPRISEKAIQQAERGVYVFNVPLSAAKVAVAQAVAANFKVKVAEVNVLTHKGKTKRFRRYLGRQTDTKKAYVKLESGQKITIFEGGK